MNKLNPVMIFIVLVLIAIAGKLGSTPQAIADLSNWKTTTYEYYYWDENPSWPIPDYKLGDAKLHASSLNYKCEQTGGRYLPNPDASCYEYFLASDAFGTSPKFTASKIIDYTPYVKVDGQATGWFDTENSKPRWKETFKFYYGPASIVIHAVDQDVNQLLGEKKKIKFLIENNLPATFEGGVSIIRTDAQFFQQSSKVVPLTISKGSKIYEVDVDFDNLGQTKLAIQPFIKVYNFAPGFTTENTGYCLNFCKSGNTCPNRCVPKSLLAFPGQITYKFQTFPNGTDLAKDVTTDCVTSLQCPSKYSCVNKICELDTGRLKPSTTSPGTTLIVDVEEPVALAEAFAAPVNPEIGLAAASIIIILLIVWTATKWR